MTKEQLQGCILNYIIKHHSTSVLNNLHLDVLLDPNKRKKDVPTETAIYRWIKDYYNKYGIIPFRADVESTFNGWNFDLQFEDSYTDVNVNLNINQNAFDAISHVIMQDANKHFIERDMVAYNNDLQRLCDNFNEFKGLVKPVSSLDTAFDKLIAESTAKANGERICLPTGFDEIDAAMGGGLHDDDYVIIAGRPKRGKSMIAAKMAADMYLKGYNVMYYNGEMSDSTVYFRFLMSIFGDSSYISLSDLENGNQACIRWLKDAQACLNARPNKFYQVTPDMLESGRCTASALEKIAMQVHADVVIIDQIQWMHPESNAWQKDERARLACISTEIRQAQMRTRIPFIALHQFKQSTPESGEMSDKLYGSDKFLQDCSLLLGLEYKEIEKYPPMKDSNGNNVTGHSFLQINCLASRHTNCRDTAWSYAIDYNKGYFSNIPYVGNEQAVEFIDNVREE